MKKKILTCLLLVILLMFPCNAFAYSYSFSFTQPFVGCAQKSSSKDVSGTTPYVYPDASYANTNYVLVVPGTTYTMASNIQTISSRTMKFFSYKTGYGGAGQKYQLGGSPKDIDFAAYSVKGNWTP